MRFRLLDLYVVLHADFVAAPTPWWGPGVSLEYQGDPGDRGTTSGWPAAPMSASTNAYRSDVVPLSLLTHPL